MCGIIGYVGPRPCKSLLLYGLERLEYRGYDSAGLALLTDDGFEYIRAVGNLQFLKDAAASVTSEATTGVGHTRWATHGRVCEENAHPLTGCEDGEVTLILNGIVENYRELKASLEEEGHRFSSETDAEVIAHLVERHYAGDLAEAVRAAYRELEGHFAFVVLHRAHPGLLVGARHQCPLLVGVGNGEMFLASMATAFLRDTRRVQFIEDDEIVAVTADGATFSTADGTVGRAARRGDRLGRGSGGEERVRDLHAEGDLRAAGRDRGDDRRPHPARAARARRPRASTTRRSGTCGASSSSPAAPRTTRASSRGTRSRNGPASPSSTTSRASGATGTPCSRRTRS